MSGPAWLLLISVLVASLVAAIFTSHDLATAVKGRWFSRCPLAALIYALDVVSAAVAAAALGALLKAGAHEYAVSSLPARGMPELSSWTGFVFALAAFVACGTGAAKFTSWLGAGAASRFRDMRTSLYGEGHPKGRCAA